MNSRQKPPSRESHIQLIVPTLLPQSDDDDFNQESILDHQYPKPLILNIYFEEIFRVLFLLLIFMGNYTLWIVDKLLYCLRLKWTWAVLFLIPGLRCIIDAITNAKLSGGGEDLIWMALSLFSLIYSGYWREAQAKKKKVSQKNEVFDLFNEKFEHFRSCAYEAKAKLDQGQNIPNELAREIHSVKKELIVIQKDLFIIPILTDDTDNLTDEQIQGLPVEKYWKNLLRNNESDMCSVCIKEFRLNEELNRLPCRHRFHKACAAEWLKEMGRCPNCKARIRMT